MAYVTDQPAFVAGRQRPGTTEVFHEPHYTELEAAGQDHSVRRAERDLGTATADIDDHGTPAPEVDRVERGEVNQAGFFRPRNDADGKSKSLLDSRDEIATIFRFADRRRCGGHDVIDTARRGDAQKPR